MPSKLRVTRKTEVFASILFVYYESIKREPKIRGIYECRCDERLQTKSKEFTRLAYTGRVYPYKYDIYIQKIQWFIHPHSEITKFHRKRKKYLYHLQKAPVPHSGFLRKECCFSLNVVFRTPFYHYLFKKKPSRCF